MHTFHERENSLNCVIYFDIFRDKKITHCVFQTKKKLSLKKIELVFMKQ